MEELLKKVGDDSQIYTCITYGLKPTSVLMTFMMIFLPKLKPNCMVQGLYYGQFPRSDKKEARWLYLKTGKKSDDFCADLILTVHPKGNMDSLDGVVFSEALKKAIMGYELSQSNDDNERRLFSHYFFTIYSNQKKERNKSMAGTTEAFN